jgi:hypothetical protein
MGEVPVEAVVLALIAGGLILLVGGVTGVRTKIATHEIDSISGAPRQLLSAGVGVGLIGLAIFLSITYLVDRESPADAGASSTTGPNPSVGSQLPAGGSSPQPSPGGAPAGGSNPVDPLNCFGTPRDVTLEPASGPPGTWTRARSKGYLEGEKVRVTTWAGSEWEATADSSGAVSVRARIPPGLQVNSVIVYVHGTRSRCGGDALFAIE